MSSEMFVALVTERLLAVEKDRKAMEQRVRDDARQMGRSFNDIMVSKKYLCVCVCMCEREREREKRERVCVCVWDMMSRGTPVDCTQFVIFVLALSKCSWFMIS